MRASPTGAAAALLALALAACGSGNGVRVGLPAPSVEAVKLTGAPVDSLRELRGRLVLYYYFAWW